MKTETPIAEIAPQPIGHKQEYTLTIRYSFGHVIVQSLDYDSVYGAFVFVQAARPRTSRHLIEAMQMYFEEGGI